MSVKVDDIKKRIKNGEFMICTDPKGKLYKMVNKMYKRHNYIIREIKLPDGCEEPNTAKAATVIASSLNKEQIDESYSEDAKYEYDQINALISLPIADPNFKTNVGRATSNQIQIAIKVMEQNGGKNKTRIAAYKRELRRRDREYGE